MFRNNTGRIAAIITLLSTAALPQTGLAASYMDTVQRGVKTSYTASLVDMTQRDSQRTTRTLDWRQPSIELSFDLPPSERTSEIVLTLSADPLTRVAPNAPLQVQFNNGAPVPVLSNGNGFEARLPFDSARSRDRGNIIRITYPAPAGESCVAPIHGAWSIDLAESRLQIGGRAKTKNMSLSEVSALLRQPALSPKTVGLIARGPEGTDMQALAAQAIALRTPDVPKFSVTPRGNDFTVIMVKRDRLFDITDDPMILNSDGPRIFVPRGRPTELIFTADTDAQIIDMLALFATRRLPNTRRAISSLGELNLQMRLDSDVTHIDGKMQLLDLALASGETSSGGQSYGFRVSDPQATQGDLLLRLSAAEDLPENSRLRVSLNGKVLGAAKLDKARKSVGFEIKPGTLSAMSNILTLEPEIQAESDFSCTNSRTAKLGFAIGDGSRLTLTKGAPSPVTELSHMTSDGGLFADAESYIVMPRETRDYEAALRVLGRLAKSTGHGLTLADYTRHLNISDDKHVLVIGAADRAKPFLMGAPKALRDVMSGQSSTGDNLLQASFERSASLGDEDMVLKYAAAQTAPRKIRRGGVAALYPSGNGRLTGLITSAPNSSFVQASRSLVEPGHWNSLQGGVARWTSSSMIMAQTAQSDAGIQKPKTDTGIQWPTFDLHAIEDLNISWPEINWPEFDVPQVGLPNLKWPSFKSADTDEPAAKPVLRREMSPTPAQTAILRDLGAPEPSVKTVNVVPRLKPLPETENLRPVSQAAGLRGKFEFPISAKSDFGSFQDIRRETKAKWSATRRWVRQKTQSLTEMKTLEDVARATDRLQDRVKPAGRNMKATLRDKMPGKGLVQLGDRTFSAYGLILMMAFGLVVLLMSLSGPTSRLGGRH